MGESFGSVSYFDIKFVSTMFFVFFCLFAYKAFVLCSLLMVAFYFYLLSLR